ncbi:MAG TPA: TonB-dependent receptor [Blastocatellia bacterium]|nr:TonB-dependent receptor [Blastocatellia bacterium]
MKSITRFIAGSLLSALLCAGAFAQSRGGALRGTVTDSSGAAISKARVIVRTPGGFVVREGVSNERGEFSFDNLNAGDYLLTVEAAGLTQTNGAEKIRIEESHEKGLAIKLQVAAITDALIVSATRTEISASESPASAWVVSASDLERSQRVSVLDALRASPGVNVAQTGRRGGITSLFVRGGESDYTKVLIDGVPINDAGGSFDLADLTTANAERIELVRGAQSALYGSDAMTGVLQLVTRRGTTQVPEFELEAEGGSFAFNRQAARLAGANRGFDYSISFAHLRTDGRDRNDDYQNRTAAANLGYRFSERTQLRLTARNENSGLGVPGATARFFPDPDERAKRRRIATGLRFDDQTARDWHQSLSFVFAESNYLSFDPAAQDLTRPNTPPDTNFAFNDFASFFSNHQRRRGLRYQSDLVLPFGNLFSVGLDWEQERAVFVSGFSGTNRNAPERHNVGVFLQDQFAYASRLLVTAGLRIENDRADLPAKYTGSLSSLGSTPFTGEAGFGTKLAPKVSVAVFARRGGDGVGTTKLRASYGEGIKAPTLVEAFSPSPFFLGNPGLRPERSRSFDAGIEQLFLNERLRVEATYFENRFRDQIAFVSDPATFGPIRLSDGRLASFINNDRARARGLELIIAARPTRHLSFGGNYTLTDSKLIEARDAAGEIGLTLLRRPKHAGALNVSWIGERFDANLDAFFIGRRRDVDPVTFSRVAYNDGYAKLDLAGSCRLTPRVSAFARIENLLNQDYQGVLGYPAYRLNFSAGMRFRIGGEK